MQNTIRYALFLFIVSGLLFTGCGENSSIDEDNFTPPDMRDEDSNTPNTPAEDTPTTSDPVEESSMYEDGTYTASGTYTSPAGPESIGVTLTVKDDIVTAVSIQNNAANETSKAFQVLFADGISGEVVGKPLESLGTFGSVNGSSLTPNGFEQALESIKGQAS